MCVCESMNMFLLFARRSITVVGAMTYLYVEPSSTLSMTTFLMLIFNANTCQSRPTECFRSLLTEQIHSFALKMPVEPESRSDFLVPTNDKTGAVRKGEQDSAALPKKPFGISKNFWTNSYQF